MVSWLQCTCQAFFWLAFAWLTLHVNISVCMCVCVFVYHRFQLPDPPADVSSRGSSGFGPWGRSRPYGHLWRVWSLCQCTAGHTGKACWVMEFFLDVCFRVICFTSRWGIHRNETLSRVGRIWICGLSQGFERSNTSQEDIMETLLGWKLRK